MVTCTSELEERPLCEQLFVDLLTLGARRSELCVLYILCYYVNIVSERILA